MSATGSDASEVIAASPWNDALLAAACIAVDPVGLGGVRVRAAAGPVRDAWSAHWRALLSKSTPIRNVPLHVDDGRLVGGLDLAASLRTGHAVEQPGLLSQIDGGYGVLSMAERIDPSTAGRMATVLETGVTGRPTDVATRFALIAFDEGDADEGLAATLAERLALGIDLRACSIRSTTRSASSVECSRASVDAARARLQQVDVTDEIFEALCAAAVALGIDSLRMPLFAVRAARVLAALAGRTVVDAEDAAGAARLVFAHRARQVAGASAPAPADGDEREADSNEQGTSDDPSDPNDPGDITDDAADAAADDNAADDSQTESDDTDPIDRPLEDKVLEATVAAIPAGLLEQLVRGAGAQRAASRSAGAGAAGRGRQRGAPAGVRRGRPRAPERLSLIETLRAAAPWQRIRRAEASSSTAKVKVRADDLHVVRFKQRHPTTTVFVIDASGSAALHRLAEAKGAIELLLADCYVRRDSVAVLAFRGKDTQMLLPPTRSLVRARRSLAGLPGGGGTPLASALDATRELVVAIRRRGETALAVLLTDGRANVARDGSGGRPRAEADALVSARALRALEVDALLIDTSPQPHPQARKIADAMGASYRPLPHAGATELSAVVNQAARSRSNAR